MSGKITAVIPVRKGSTRCKNKNIRSFGNTNLLKLKIKTLKKVKGIDRILVSSNCDKMLEIARAIGVDIHKRSEIYCTTDCSGSKFMVNLAEQVSTEYFMYSTCVTPLVTNGLVETCIAKINHLDVYDSIVLANVSKNFLWDNNQPINYDLNKAPPSQELPEYYIPNFACCLIRTKHVLEHRNVIGKKPMFIHTDPIAGIDIDENSDFITAELLYKNNILNENVCKMILERRGEKVELLDCTIRDGGYLNNWSFSEEEVLDCYKAVTEAGYEYFEIGFRTNEKSLPDKGKWCYSKDDDIDNICQKYKGCKIVVMAKIGTVSITDFVERNESNISMVRVLLARSTLENDGCQKSYYNRVDIVKAKTFCEELLNYGYDVCMNFGCADIINDDEIEIIASEFHNVQIKALYLADTYGGFNSTNLPVQLHKFFAEFKKYGSNIAFGFHCHNNNENASSKVSTAIYHGCTMIDSCIGGLGRGAGNLKSEQLMSILHSNSEYIKRIAPLLLYFDKHILSKSDYCKNNYIQAHPYYMISSVFSLHPNYILEILHMNTGVNEDINLILQLDKYTKKKNERNYNKKLIKMIVN